MNDPSGLFGGCLLVLPAQEVKASGGGTGQQRTRAWRELCRLSSEFSGLHRGSGILLPRAGETRAGSEQCLSSSLHNQFITFYRKTL